MDQFVVAVFKDSTGFFPQSNLSGKFPSEKDAEWIFSTKSETSLSDAWDKAIAEANRREIKVPSLNFL